MCCVSIAIISLSSVIYFFYLKNDYKVNGYPNITTTNISYDDNKLTITYELNNTKLNHNKIYCNYGIDNEEYNTFTNEWKETTNNKCVIQLSNQGKYYVYLKNENNTIYKVDSTENYGSITDIKLNKENIYLAINGEEKINYEVTSVGNIDISPTLYSDNDKIATIDNDGKIKGISKGNTNINIKVGNIVKQINVLVTDLIVKRPNKFNSKKNHICLVINIVKKIMILLI
ncbi:MAG: Ig-like domain-containing protein [Clostridium sp.]|nr:MAG: Ig-like domain-containing protein [Clostridium sp.]